MNFGIETSAVVLQEPFLLQNFQYEPRIMTHADFFPGFRQERVIVVWRGYSNNKSDAVENSFHCGVV